jgi:serine/threonine protein kinase
MKPPAEGDAAEAAGTSAAGQARPSLHSIIELSGRPVGTPGWISPEAARGERTTPASDIYGLGLIIHYAMTRDRLIKAPTRSGLVRAQCQAASITREQLPASWPPRLRDIVVQCLQADPADRYQSAETLAADLLRALMPHEEDGTVVLMPHVSSMPVDSMIASSADRDRQVAATNGDEAEPAAPRRTVSPYLSWSVLAALGIVAVALWWTLWRAL